MTFSTNYCETLIFWIWMLFNTRAKLNVGTPTSHVGCNGYSTLLTSIHNDLCFTEVIFRIQNFMRNFSCDQFFRNNLRSFNSNRTNQDRLSLSMTFLHVVQDSIQFCFKCWVKQVWMVHTADRTVRWYRDNLNIIDFTELFFFRFRCTSHP